MAVSHPRCSWFLVRIKIKVGKMEGVRAGNSLLPSAIRLPGQLKTKILSDRRIFKTFQSAWPLPDQYPA